MSEQHASSENGEYVDGLDVEDSISTEDKAEENVALQAERLALIRQVRSSAGAEEFVQSVVQQTVLSSDCDWGALLSSAPRALCHLGQCFVVASTPLAASLRLPDDRGLEAKSLRGNLVHCSDLGREAFREAEAKMGKVTMIAQAICESNGTIDKILAAIEDDELAEFELPRQLKKLRKVSEECTKDTAAIQKKVAAWKDYAVKIRMACEDENQTVLDSERRLESEVVVKDNSKALKYNAVNASKEQTEDYKKRLAARQDEYMQSSSEMKTGIWKDLAEKGAETIMGAATSLLNPTFGIRFSWSKPSKNDTSTDATRTDSSDVTVDDGYKLAEEIAPILQQFSRLMFSSEDPTYYGMDWRSLSGLSGDRRKSADVIVGTLHELLSMYSTHATPVIRAVQDVIDPVLVIGTTLMNIIHQQSNLHSRGADVIDRQDVNKWQKQVKDAQRKNSKIIEERLYIEKEKAKEHQKNNKKTRTHAMTKAEIRFERFQQAQQALFQAEELLSQRMEAERKANEEFEEIQLELQRLGDEKMTVAKVKDILQRCIRNLQQFAERLDDLNKFFTEVQIFIERINEDRVDEFVEGADSARRMIDRASGEARERKKQQRIGALKIDALKLRGFYLVAQAMADTYVTVSNKYIIPGVNKVDRLSINADGEVSEVALQEKIDAVESFARQAQDQITKLASKRKQAILDELIDDRGEATEVMEIEDKMQRMPGALMD